MLAGLRASVSQEKESLVQETRQLKEQLAAIAETSRAQDRTINQLLLDKIELQSDSIGQRERMLERERDVSFALSPLSRVTSLTSDTVISSPVYLRKVSLMKIALSLTRCKPSSSFNISIYKSLKLAWRKPKRSALSDAKSTSSD